MKLQDRIKGIAEYFQGFEINNGLYIIRIKYGRKWGVYPSDNEKIMVTRSEEQENEWFYYAKCDEVELEDMFNLIEDTIKTNKSTMAKVELLKVKIEELKVLFETSSLETLQTLEFRIGKPKIKRVRKSTKEAKETPTAPLNEEITSINEVVEEEV